jgi:pyruvate formate lyase activating enzyme
MRLGGIIDISTKDIPGRSSMVFFTVGCNFKCEFCHNKYLLKPKVGREYNIDELIDKITTNLLVSGVSFTGGEPTLQKDLIELCKRIQNTNKYISIDTNGSNPEVIKELAPFINRIAMDLKGPMRKEKFEHIAGVKVDLEKILETIKFLNKQENIDFEIRTTYVGRLIEPKDIEDIISFLNDLRFNGNFVLQQYQFLEGVGEKYKKAFSKPEHDVLLDLIEPFINKELYFEFFLRDDVVGYQNINELQKRIN